MVAIWFLPRFKKRPLTISTLGLKCPVWQENVIGFTEFVSILFYAVYLFLPLYLIGYGFVVKGHFIRKQNFYKVTIIYFFENNKIAHPL